MNLSLAFKAICAGALVALHCVAHSHDIADSTNKNQRLDFKWTENGVTSTKPWSITFPPPNGGIISLTMPNGGLYSSSYGTTSFVFHSPEGATDWEQVIYTIDRVTGKESKSDVYGGNIKRDSPWHYESLDSLPNVGWRIPDITPAESGTIYTAVNLDLYFKSNPLGMNGGAWQTGQSLNDLGISIVNGQIAGLQGIYWSTTPFEFDPNPDGFGFMPTGGLGTLLNSTGSEWIAAQHVPEPQSYLMFAAGLVMLARTFRRGR